MTIHTAHFWVWGYYYALRREAFQQRNVPIARLRPVNSLLLTVYHFQNVLAFPGYKRYHTDTYNIVILVRSHPPPPHAHTPLPLHYTTVAKLFTNNITSYNVHRNVSSTGANDKSNKSIHMTTMLSSQHHETLCNCILITLF